jgi:hypothetical protein
MSSNPTITFDRAMQVLQAMARRRGERIYMRRDSKLKHELGEGYAVIRRGNVFLSDGRTPDGCDFSLADLARRYGPLAKTDLQRAAVQAILSSGVDQPPAASTTR